MEELRFETGLMEFSVNGGRVIRFNPSDQGFIETLYDLVAKIDAIGSDMEKKKDKAAADPAKLFDIVRGGDQRMREAVNCVFGEGFCAEVFDGIRLTAMAGGLTVLENFVFAVIDRMDDSLKENMAKRSDRIAKYTAKYQKYSKK